MHCRRCRHDANTEYYWDCEVFTQWSCWVSLCIMSFCQFGAKKGLPLAPTLCASSNATTRPAAMLCSMTRLKHTLDSEQALSWRYTRARKVDYCEATRLEYLVKFLSCVRSPTFWISTAFICGRRLSFLRLLDVCLSRIYLSSRHKAFLRYLGADSATQVGQCSIRYPLLDVLEARLWHQRLHHLLSIRSGLSKASSNVPGSGMI